MAYTDRQLALFSEIAYKDLPEECKLKLGRNQSVTIEEVIKYDPEIGDDLRNLGITESEIKTWKIVGFKDANSKNGFYGCVIETSENQAAVAFRGSEAMNEISSFHNDWAKSDLGLLNNDKTPQQEEVEIFLEENYYLLDEYDDITMTGHSLGGNLAEYATIMAEKYGLDDNITRCTSLDGPGFSDEFLIKYKDEIERCAGKIRHVRWSMVGHLLMDIPNATYEQVDVKPGKGAGYVVMKHSLENIRIEGENTVPAAEDGVSIASHGLSCVVDISNCPYAAIAVDTAIIASMIIDMKDVIGDDWESYYRDLCVSVFDICINVGILALYSTGPVGQVAALCAILITKIENEKIKEFEMKAAEFLCDACKAIEYFTREMALKLKDLVINSFEAAEEWVKYTYNPGYKYSTDNSYIKVDTDLLRSYARRLDRVNKKLTAIDKDMDALYRCAGFLDLINIMNLLSTDIMTGPSYRVYRCKQYLEYAADKFDEAENKIGAL